MKESEKEARRLAIEALEEILLKLHSSLEAGQVDRQPVTLQLHITSAAIVPVRPRRRRWT